MNTSNETLSSNNLNEQSFGSRAQIESLMPPPNLNMTAPTDIRVTNFALDLNTPAQTNAIGTVPIPSKNFNPQTQPLTQQQAENFQNNNRLPVMIPTNSIQITRSGDTNVQVKDMHLNISPGVINLPNTIIHVDTPQVQNQEQQNSQAQPAAGLVQQLPQQLPQAQQQQQQQQLQQFNMNFNQPNAINTLNLGPIHVNQFNLGGGVSSQAPIQPFNNNIINNSNVVVQQPQQINAQLNPPTQIQVQNFFIDSSTSRNNQQQSNNSGQAQSIESFQVEPKKPNPIINVTEFFEISKSNGSAGKSPQPHQVQKQRTNELIMDDLCSSGDEKKATTSKRQTTCTTYPPVTRDESYAADGSQGANRGLFHQNSIPTSDQQSSNCNGGNMTSGSKTSYHSGILKKTQSEMPCLAYNSNPFEDVEQKIFYQHLGLRGNNNVMKGNYQSKLNQELISENRNLRQLLAQQQKQMDFLNQFIKQQFKTPDILKQQNDLGPEKLAVLNRCFHDRPLVALTFASPLIQEIDFGRNQEQQQVRDMDLLDYQREFQSAINGMKKTNNAIRVKKVHATLDNFTSVLTDNPVGLHFSGHGLLNTKEEIGLYSSLIHNEGNCLVFETPTGSAHYVSESKLKDLLQATCNLSFVFIASCHSKWSGQVFHNAGVEHVICIKQSEEILDEACLKFAEIFYELIFKEKLDVCNAFYTAQNTLKANADLNIAQEYHKFILIKAKDEHKCKVLGPYPSGEVEVTNQRPIFSYDLAKVEEFVGRQIEMQKLVESVSQNRLVTVVGLPGIGKTTLCKAVGHFLIERNIFSDGVIFFSLRGKDQTSRLIQQMYLFLGDCINKARKSGLDQDPDELVRGDSLSIARTLAKNESEITSVDAKLQLNSEEQTAKIFGYLQDRNVLIIIDNVEDCLRKDGDALRDFLASLYEKNPHLKILSTSRDLINNIGEVTEKVIELKPLSNSFTIELLFKKSLKEIPKSEVDELLDMRPPKKVLFAQPASIQEVYNQAQKNPLQKGRINLEDHHLCTLLGGHPHAISLIAPLLQNRSLAQVYQMLTKMMNSTNFINDLHELNPISSLKVSLDASIQHMRKNNDKCIELFCLLGLLPGGVTDDQLTELWKSDEWILLAQKLKQASLLVVKQDNSTFQQRKQTKQCLLPFMNKYAESLLNKVELVEFHNRCLCFLSFVLRKLYLELCVEQFRHNQSELKIYLLDYETNIWSCIYRIIDLNSNTIQKEKSKYKLTTHAHHINGYSSADDYEAVLISDLTSDAERIDPQMQPVQQKTNYLGLQKSAQHSVKRSIKSSLDTPIESSQDANDDQNQNNQGSSIGIRDSQQDNNNLGQISSDDPIEPATDRSAKNSDRKRVRFSEDGDKDQTKKNPLKHTTFLNESEKRDKYSIYRTQEGIEPTTLSEVQEMVNDSASNESDHNNSSDLSDPNESPDLKPEHQDIKVKVKKSLFRNKTTGDLHSPNNGEDLFAIAEEIQRSPQSPKALPKKYTSYSQIPSANSVLIKNFDEKKFESSQDDSREGSVRSRESNKSSLEEVFQESGYAPQTNRKDGLTENYSRTLAPTDESFKSSQTNVSQKTKDLQYKSDFEIGDPNISTAEATDDQNKLNKQSDVFQNPMKPQFTFKKSSRKQSKPKTYSTELKPIQEKSFKLTDDGHFLVTYVSVLILNFKQKDALRTIRMVLDAEFPDVLCNSNLVKLQGIAFMELENIDGKQVFHLKDTQKQQQAKQALKCFEDAEKQFLKRSASKQNIGVAQAQAAQGFLLFKKSEQFLQAYKNNEKFIWDRAVQKLQSAKAIYKEAQHKAGESLCAHYLVIIMRKLGSNISQILAESKKLKTEMSHYKQDYIFRYTGEQISILLQIVNQNELGLNAPNSNTLSVPQHDHCIKFFQSFIIIKNCLQKL